MPSVPNWEGQPDVRLPWWRTLLGILVALAVVVLAVLYAAGAWNPWRFVILLQYFANPWLGLAIVAAGTYLTLWLLLPISNEARQHVRIAIRVVVVIIGGLGIVVGVNLHPLFRYEATVLDRTDDEQRAVALVISGGLAERSLRVWQGPRIWPREAGSMGRPCGGFVARFEDRDTVLVNQGYGDWLLDLDPDTGRPLQVLAFRCPVGPIPAP